MQKREGRSFAPPPPAPSRLNPGCTGRKRWERSDVPRPVAPARVPLPSADPLVPVLDLPEPMTRLEHVFLLPGAVRLELLAGSLGDNGTVTL